MIQRNISNESGMALEEEHYDIPVSVLLCAQ